MSLFNIKNVHAEFYGAEFIDNIYMSKYEYSTGTTYYQKAKMMKNSYNEPVYCIDPFSLFDEGAQYTRNDNVNNMDPYTIDRIKKIAHFGYGYGNHTDPIWYAATQMLIWREANSNIGRFYFTDTLNGNEITILENEMNEIKNLVTYYNLDLFQAKEYEVLENSSLAIVTGEIINYYTTDSENITIRNNTVGVWRLKEGYHEIKFTRKENINNRPGYMYSAPNCQSLLERGDLEDKEAILKVHVHKSKITINKLDKDTNSTTPQGEASLDGAVYGIFNKSTNKKIKELTINNNQATIEGISSGSYYIKEITPGIGYELNEEQYDFILNTSNYIVDIDVKNKVIEKKIVINKQYGEINNLSSESDIVFDIYNYKNELVKTIVTNEEGKAEVILPYGKYKIVQANTTPGYNKNKPIDINIENKEEETIELVDYKIEVPNTSSKRSIILLLIGILFIIL